MQVKFSPKIVALVRSNLPIPNWICCFVVQKCAKALALLPKAHGDATTWSSLIRRILIAINFDLDFAFRGMEDGELFICICLLSVCQFS